MKFTRFCRNVFTTTTVEVPPTFKSCVYAGDLIRTGLLDGIDERSARLLTGVFDSDDSMISDPLLTLHSSDEGTSYSTDRFDHIDHLSRSGISHSYAPDTSPESNQQTADVVSTE